MLFYYMNKFHKIEEYILKYRMTYEQTLKVTDSYSNQTADKRYSD